MIARHRYDIRISRDQHDRRSHCDTARRSREQLPVMRIWVGVERRVKWVVCDLVCHRAHAIVARGWSQRKDLFAHRRGRNGVTEEIGVLLSTVAPSDASA